jgi:hypothetical protein
LATRRGIAFAETFRDALHQIIVKKHWKWALTVVIAVFVLMQLTNLARTNPAVVAGHDLSSTNPPPPEIAAMLRSACYDCHSYETHWPWYGHVAPVSWWLDGHVRDARERLNFSEWPHDNPQRAAKKWNRVSEEVRDGEMPLPSYARIHRAARLTEEQRNKLADWAEQEAQRLKATNVAVENPAPSR